MITDDSLKEDRQKIIEQILSLETALAQKQQEIQQIQTQIIRFGGVLSYLDDNKPKDGE